MMMMMMMMVMMSEQCSNCINLIQGWLKKVAECEKK